MVARSKSPESEYMSAQTSIEQTEACSSRQASLAPLDPAIRRGIMVSRNLKRDLKDKKIYVNPRTGLPVRPPTSFGLFKHTLRRTMNNNKVGFSEFNKLATEQWTKMSSKDKEVYAQRSKALAQQYKRIEVPYLRKRVRQLQQQIKEYRQASAQFHRRFSR